MQNSIWKMAVLAGVVGIGFLVVLQAQRSISQHAAEQAAQTAAPGSDGGADPADAQGEVPFDVAAGQREPGEYASGSEPPPGQLEPEPLGISAGGAGEDDAPFGGRGRIAEADKDLPPRSGPFGAEELQWEPQEPAGGPVNNGAVQPAGFNVEAGEPSRSMPENSRHAPRAVSDHPVAEGAAADAERDQPVAADGTRSVPAILGRTNVPNVDQDAKPGFAESGPDGEAAADSGPLFPAAGGHVADAASVPMQDVTDAGGVGRVSVSADGNGDSPEPGEAGPDRRDAASDASETDPAMNPFPGADSESHSTEPPPTDLEIRSTESSRTDSEIRSTDEPLEPSPFPEPENARPAPSSGDSNATGGEVGSDPFGSGAAVGDGHAADGASVQNHDPSDAGSVGHHSNPETPKKTPGPAESFPGLDGPIAPDPAGPREPSVPEPGAFDPSSPADPQAKDEQNLDEPGTAETDTAQPESTSPESKSPPSAPVPIDPPPGPGSAQPESAVSRSPPTAPGSPGNDTGPAADRERPGSAAGAPGRLDPPPQAQKIEAEPDLHGDGVLDASAPSGPQRPQLKIEKVAPTHAVLGKPLIYHIVVTNVGGTTAHQVVVEDRIPKGSKLTGTIPQARLAEKRLIWKLGRIEPGGQKRISVRVIPVEQGQIGSVATVNFVAEVAARTVVTAPSLGLEVEGPGRVRVGDPVTFTFTISNTGSGTARGVWLRDIIPDGLKHPAGNDLEYHVGTLPAGQSTEVKLTLTAAREGPATNRAVVTADGGLRIEEKASLKVAASRLVLSRSGPEREFVGRQAVYTNLVTNDSSRSVEGTTITEILPAGMDFVEASDGGQYDPARRQVAWRIDRLGPNESKALKVKLMPRREGALTSVVQADDGRGGVARVESQTLVSGFASVGVEVPAVAGPVEVGGTARFRVIVRNRGTATAEDVRLALTLPDQLEVASVHSELEHTQADGKLTFQPIASLKPDAGTTVDVVLRARSAGDARVGVEIVSDGMQKPIYREEPVLVLPAP